MKKTIMKYVVAVMLMMSLALGFSLTAYANGQTRQDVVGTIVDESVLLTPSVMGSRSAQPDERSAALAQAACEITNEGGGVVGGYAETLCHIDVIWMCLTLYLEQYDAATDSWVYCQDYYQEFEPDENGILHMVTYSFTKSVEPGYYYRVRALHELEYEDEEGDIWYEAKSTRTDGIMITSTP